jgi:hypothetical protein
MTIDTYGHMVPGAEADAVDGLAGFARLNLQQNQALKTGTDDAPIKGGALYAQCATRNTRAARRRHARIRRNKREECSLLDSNQQPTD